LFKSSFCSFFFCFFCFFLVKNNLGPLSGLLGADHCDYQPLVQTLERVRQIADALNEASSRSENEIAVRAVQDKIAHGRQRMRQAGLSNLSGEPGRFFTFEAELFWPNNRSRSRKTKWMLVRCFLFSDLLMAATPKEVSPAEEGGVPELAFKYKVALPLRQIELIPRASTAKPVPDKIFPDASWVGEWLHLKLMEYGAEYAQVPSKTRLITLITRDTKENRQWRHFLQTALSKLGNHPLEAAELARNRTMLAANAF
jgi:hypothetical protein